MPRGTAPRPTAGATLAGTDSERPMHAGKQKPDPPMATRVACIRPLRLREVFHRGKEIRVHHFDRQGGGSVCTARCRVVFAHSLPQSRSAGRNLITVFHSVNKCSRFFFDDRRACDGHGVATGKAGSPSTTTATLQRESVDALKASNCRALRSTRGRVVVAPEHMRAEPWRNDMVNFSPCRCGRESCNRPPSIALHNSKCAAFARTSRRRSGRRRTMRLPMRAKKNPRRQ